MHRIWYKVGERGDIQNKKTKTFKNIIKNVLNDTMKII